MTLTAEQEQAIQNSQAVPIAVGDTACAVLRKDIYERSDAVDYAPWTKDEMDLLAAETADLLVGNGFDDRDAA